MKKYKRVKWVPDFGAELMRRKSKEPKTYNSCIPF